MNYSIEQQDAGIAIRIEGDNAKAKQFLDVVRHCEQSIRKGCAVNCGEIASIEEAGQGATVELRLVPRAGEHIDVNDVRRCLQILWGNGASNCSDG